MTPLAFFSIFGAVLAAADPTLRPSTPPTQRPTTLSTPQPTDLIRIVEQGVESAPFDRILLLGRMAELQPCESSTYAISERGAGGLRPGARVRNTSYGANRPAGECRIWSRGTHRNASRLRAARRAEFGVDVEQGDAGAAGEPI